MIASFGSDVDALSPSFSVNSKGDVKERTLLRGLTLAAASGAIVCRHPSLYNI